MTSIAQEKHGCCSITHQDQNHYFAIYYIKESIICLVWFFGEDSVRHNKLDFSDKNSKDVQVTEEKQKFSQFLIVGWSLRMLESHA